MRILIDFTQIPVRRAGAGVYAENLARQIPSFLHGDDLLFLLLQSDERMLPQLVSGMKNVRTLFIPSYLFRNRLFLMLFEQFILPWILLNHAIDVVHSLHYTIPLWAPSARVVTFHDLSMLRSYTARCGKTTAAGTRQVHYSCAAGRQPQFISPPVGRGAR
jgi:hypothetical protein